MWFNILKQRFNIQHNTQQLENLKKYFNSNNTKAIGYIPIEFGIGIENEIEQLASQLGLQYKRYEQLREITNPIPNNHSFANGGHFMWNPDKIEPYLNQTEFTTVQELINFIANNSYIGKPYEKIIHSLFGDSNIKLRAHGR